MPVKKCLYLLRIIYESPGVLDLRKVSYGRTMLARRSSKVSRVVRGKLSDLAILAAEIIEHYSNFVVLLSPLPHKCRHMSFLSGTIVVMHILW